MTEHQRLAREWLAVADALRTARAQLSRLIATGDPVVSGRPETGKVLIDGLTVATALEQLAARLAEENRR